MFPERCQFLWEARTLAGPPRVLGKIYGEFLRDGSYTSFIWVEAYFVSLLGGHMAPG